MSAELVEVIDEKYGLKITGMSANEIMDPGRLALKISCLGGLKHDRNKNVVSLQSKLTASRSYPGRLCWHLHFKWHGQRAPHNATTTTGAR